MLSEDQHPSKLKGSCFCGAVTYTVSGEPSVRAYCHCSLCQRLSGCPFIHTIHFPASAFTWTHASSPSNSHLDLPGLEPYSVPQKPHKTRVRCAQCGVFVASYNANTHNWSVWGAHLQRGEDGRILKEVWEKVKPTGHIFYGTRMLDVLDGLSKWEGYENKSQKIEEN